MKKQGSLTLQNITPSQNTVTAGQNSEWTIALAVKNTSAIPLTINFQPSKTFIKFLAPADITSQYVIEYPTEFNGGGTVLAAGVTGVMTFTIQHVANVVEALKGNKTQAAEILGIDRKTLNKKLKNHLENNS